jgi:hypothetical protein
LALMKSQRRPGGGAGAFASDCLVVTQERSLFRTRFVPYCGLGRFFATSCSEDPTRDVSYQSGQKPKRGVGISKKAGCLRDRADVRCNNCCRRAREVGQRHAHHCGSRRSGTLTHLRRSDDSARRNSNTSRSPFLRVAVCWFTSTARSSRSWPIIDTRHRSCPPNGSAYTARAALGTRALHSFPYCFAAASKTNRGGGDQRI